MNRRRNGADGADGFVLYRIQCKMHLPCVFSKTLQPEKTLNFSPLRMVRRHACCAVIFAHYDQVLQPVNITTLVESTVEDFMEAGAQLSIDSSVEIRLNARPHALRRCLTNLIDNALKYGVIEVVIAIEVLQTEVIIGVRDHGTGIPWMKLIRYLNRFIVLKAPIAEILAGPV